MCLIPKRRPALIATLIATCLTSLLGIGSSAASAAMTVIPSGATAVSASNEYDCALLEDGTARCWGRNGFGALGNGTTSWTWNPNPVTVSGLGSAIGISTGWSHTCALLAGGTAECWGSNQDGKLGDGTKTDRTTPVAVSGLSGAVAISAGSNHTCALLEDGTARCWGDNGSGELGDGTKTDRTTPVAVSGLSGAVAISAGVSHSCALLEDGTAKCWGWNGTGQLGDGTNAASTTPVAVSGLSGAGAISAGDNYTCAVLNNGTGRCWGWNIDGQLGDGTKLTERTAPVAVSGLSGAVAISAFGDHTCALLEDRTARCWGWGGSGELGGVAPAGVGGEFVESLTPAPVFNLNDATVISAGHRHTCAIHLGGAVECWGLDYGWREDEPRGQPEDGSAATGSRAVPPRVKITSHPSKETANRHAVFAFTGAPGGSYECSIDAERWRPCTSGGDFGPLDPGDHRFRVRETLAGLTGPADSYSWTIVLPRACVLKWARARVSIPAHQNRARLVIHYKAYKPARVTVSYALKGRKGSLRLGTASARFKTLGFYRRGKRLGKGAIAKLRATKSMTVRFSIPQAPSSCTRYYTKRLTIPHHPRPDLTVWFQSDSVFGVGW